MDEQELDVRKLGYLWSDVECDARCARACLVTLVQEAPEIMSSTFAASKIAPCPLQPVLTSVAALYSVIDKGVETCCGFGPYETAVFFTPEGQVRFPLPPCLLQF